MEHDVMQKAARPRHRTPTAAKGARETKALELLAEGNEIGEVAKRLGVSRATVTRWQRARAPMIDAASDARVEGIIEGGARAKARLIAHGEDLALVLVDAAMGRLRVHLDPRHREALDDDEPLPIESDPAMINARTKAAMSALGFIIASKSDVDVHVGKLSPEKQALVSIAIEQAAKAR